MNSSTHKQFLKDLYKEQKKIPSLIEVLADQHKDKQDQHKDKHLIIYVMEIIEHKNTEYRERSRFLKNL